MGHLHEDAGYSIEFVRFLKWKLTLTHSAVNGIFKNV
jgi:hypothetical protein